MHAITIVQDVLRKGCPHIHAKRLNALLLATRAALHASSHTLSNLARALEGASAVRHRVKRMDRLLGSRALQQECASVYAAMARHWLLGNDTPLIVVDWSDLNESRSAQMIRASVALVGRSLTLYEEVHSMKAATTPAVHIAFLARLRSMLPAGCQPIIITDAGFRSPWFRAVEALGWHWVGRSRNRDMVRRHGAPGAPHAAWQGCKHLYVRATGKALDLGVFDCVRNRPHVHRLILIKKTPKGRFMPTVNGARSRSNHSKKQARAQSEPWLLAASTSLAHLSANAIVAIYTQRMQIEQSFRDTKNARFGLGLSNSASRTPERLAVLALIASLAEFVLRLIGQCAINHHLQYDLQLTNRKTRPEISVIRMGMLLVDSALSSFTSDEFRQTMQAWAKPHFALRT
jgi:hypothetical protein